MDLNSVIKPLASGAAAGFAVDLSLYPVDTIKTRLQSKSGFFKAGGFRRLYSGIGSIVVGSTPGAAVFFTAYESTRHFFQKHVNFGTNYEKVTFDMTAACVGEVFACLVRVPTEVIKQRAQVNTGMSSLKVLQNCVREEGLMGLYRGYRSTLMREIPFSVIQFPLWELMKTEVAKRQCDGVVTSVQSAWCGFFSGGISAALTTPLDVAKTRIMLANAKDAAAKDTILYVLNEIRKNEGIKSLFSGVVPRVVLISVGGFIFLGMYDFANNQISHYWKI